jgi:hypothetical protein
MKPSRSKRQEVIMSTAAQYTNDVYVSYSEPDTDWVRDHLLPQLEGAGLKVAIDYRAFELGLPKLVNVERAVKQSRRVLLVLTPNWVGSEWANLDALLIQTQDPAGYMRRMIPLLLEPCHLPDRLAMLTPADFTRQADREAETARLIRALKTHANIFISYKRNVTPDEALAKQLYAALAQAGHKAFLDQTMPVGVEWAREIEQQIDDCDFLVVLLSPASVQSEMVAKEVDYAAKRYQRTGRSRLLPVRVSYDQALPYPLSHHLDHIQQTSWAQAEDTERLIGQLLGAVSHFAPLPGPPPALAPRMADGITPPRSAADPRFVESLRDPSGATRLKSEFYLQREGDERLHRELGKAYGTTTTIRAPRQTGKSSLLIRGVAQAQAQGSRAALIDLQPADETYFESLDSFLRYFVTAMLAKLRLDTTEIEKAWRSALGASDKATYVLEDHILTQFDGKIILAIDEADRLLRTSFHDSFFGLLRFWHNSRAMNELWEKLDILMVISTEPHLLIKDVAQSPFNVGVRIVLSDFDQEQVADMNRRYRSPLDQSELADAMDFLNGHPYLTRKAMYTMVTEGRSWSQIKQLAGTHHGLFADHLKRYLWLLHDQPELRDALKQIIAHRHCPDEALFYRLSQAGLVKGDDSRDCSCRCRLYESYLKDKL